VILLSSDKQISKLDQLSQADLPLLICGVAGVPGYNAFFHFRHSYGEQVIGQRTTRNWPLHRQGMIACDVEDTPRFRQLLEDYQVKTILNCGGSCALKSCELDPEMARRVNVLTVQKILEAIEGTGIRLLHLSIDLVFSGNRAGDYREEDQPDPVTVYGKTMVQAERLILERRPDSCVLRISLPMGVSFNGHAGAIDWIQHRFAKNKPATLYFDEIRTPTYVECMNELFDEVLARQISGIYHAGGTRKLSLYQIAQIVNRVGGYDPDLLKGCPRIEAGPIPPRAGNVTLNSEKLSAILGRQPFANWPLSEQHVPRDRNWHYEREAFVGSKRLLEQQLYLRPSD
jgi:dTDP-4-dehydrorhamnose reductase